MPSPDLRRTVLDASLELIEDEGLSALSMREVARRAGVSHQAPYHHFQDREGILAAIATEGFERLHAAMKRATAKATDPVDRLNAIGAAYLTFAVRYSSHFKIMFRSELVAMDRYPELSSIAEAAFEFVASVIGEAAIRRGAKDPLPYVIAAWSLAHGAATLLLEGKFDWQYGQTDSKRIAGALSAIETFGNLLSGKIE
jgi:AcrR family transcriptional regulator